MESSENSLQAPELQEIIDSWPGFVLLVSQQGKFLKISKSADIYAKSPQLIHVIAEFVKSDSFRKTFEIDLELMGQSLPFVITIESLFSSAGGFVVVGQSVLQLKQLREELDRERAKSELTSRLASVADLAAGVAHEINNPLAIIRAKIEQLGRAFAKKETDPQFIEKCLVKMDEAAGRVHHIVQLLSKISDPQKKQLKEIIDVNQLVSNILVLFQARISDQGIQFSVQSVGPTKILGSTAQIAQALMHLLRNSCDAMRSTSTKILQIQTSIEQNHVCLSVSDTGVGIPPEYNTRLFQPFFTTKPQGEGVGLGLATSLSILKEHGGNLTLVQNSNPTTFKMILGQKIQ